MKNQLATILFCLASFTAQAYVIEEEMLDEPVGSPAQDAFKVTVSVPGDPADDPGDNSFNVNWVVPKEDTNPLAPADLTATANFQITDFNATTLVMEIAIHNTFDPALGINSVMSFGFFVDPDIESAALVNHSDPNNVIWTEQLDDQLTGNFKHLDICIFPDEQSNSCNGGNVSNGLVAGASDLLTLTLTGNFVGQNGDISTVMLSEFPVKFQGDWGSFEVPGGVDCCGGPSGGTVPEPATLGLAVLGLGLVRRSHARFARTSIAV